MKTYAESLSGRWQHAAVTLIEFDALRIAEAVRLAFFLESRKVGAFLEEIFVSAFQILECLLQGLAWRFVQPERFRPRLPFDERFAQCGIAELLFSSLVPLLLQRQCLVVDEPARTSEATHETLRF